MPPSLYMTLGVKLQSSDHSVLQVCVVLQLSDDIQLVFSSVGVINGLLPYMVRLHRAYIVVDYFTTPSVACQHTEGEYHLLTTHTYLLITL